MAKRFGHQVWGSGAPRRFFGPAHWREPLEWNSEAVASGRRERVFCCSMADIFKDHPGLDAPRQQLWELILATPALDWLLLSKRPENIRNMVPWRRQWPANVWLGTTVESQEYAERRLPHLLEHPAAVRFVSCEPLLGELDLLNWLNPSLQHSIDWVIVGGESGAGARPMRRAWALSLLRQCREDNVAYFFKQWGSFAPQDLVCNTTRRPVNVAAEGEAPDLMVNVGKSAAGRLLAGKTWNQLPPVNSTLAVGVPHSTASTLLTGP